MAESHTNAHNLDEQFEFSAALKKKIFTILGIGIVLAAIGLVLNMSGGDDYHHAALDTTDLVSSIGEEGHGHAAEAEHSEAAAPHAEGGHGEHHGSPGWLKRLFANLWINNIYFTGIALAGIFFFAIQYVASAGWSAGLIRVMGALSRFLPISLGLMLVVFFAGSHDLFHWTHSSLYDVNSPDYDAIIAGKQGFLSLPFYLSRMVIFFLGWIFFSWILNKESSEEDNLSGVGKYRRLVKISACFLVFFAVSSSISAWDWVMSIDTHWFSTMFGWYVFASWFVTGLATITMIVIILKENGYMSIINENHLHDLGKFVFAFSIFWTYVWFSQFLLIFYANIPEETVYFVDRFSSQYGKFIFINLFLNFAFPFLGLMTRDAKRKITMLKVVCTVVMVGHWLDFFLMIMPGTTKEAGGFGLMEVGLAMVYLGIFAFVVFTALSKVKLIPKNHPMLDECIHHHT